jgi:hypothetical protein
MGSFFLQLTAVLTTTLLVATSLPAQDKNFFSIPETNRFATNAVGTNALSGLKPREVKPLDKREFGFFNSWRSPAPASFGSANPTPNLTPVVPRNSLTPDKEDNSKRDWIFRKSEDVSAESIFKVSNFGMKDKEKEKEKGQSAFARFIAEGYKTSDEAGKGSEMRNQGRAQDGSFRNRDNEQQEAGATKTRDDSEMKADGVVKDFKARSSADNSFNTDSRPNAVSTRTSIFGEFFGGSRLSQERWAEQASARRSEFQQIFEPRSNSESTRPSAAQVTPTSVMDTQSEFNRASVTGLGNDFRSLNTRSSLDDFSRRQAGPSGIAPGLDSAAESRKQYAPAVLPFPQRPGSLFK